MADDLTIVSNEPAPLSIVKSEPMGASSPWENFKESIRGTGIAAPLTDIPREAIQTTEDQALSAWRAIVGTPERREEAGKAAAAGPTSPEFYAEPFKRIGEVGAGLFETATLPIAPVIGAARSLVGHPYGAFLETIGMIEPGKGYEEGKRVTDTAMMGIRPGKVPTAAKGAPTPAAAPAMSERLISPSGKPWTTEELERLIRIAKAQKKQFQDSLNSPALSSTIPRSHYEAQIKGLEDGIQTYSAELARRTGGRSLESIPAETPLTPPVREAPPVEAVPKETVVSTSDDLNRLVKSVAADKAEITQRLEAVPKPMMDPVVQEKIYHAVENPQLRATLTPEELAVVENTLKPMQAEAADLYQKIKGYGYPIEDPTYIHRMAKGHQPRYDTLETGSSADPVMGTRTLSPRASATQERKYFAIEDEAGNRKVVTKSPDGFTVWNEGKKTNIPSSAELIPGEELIAGGKPWSVKQATTAEIEANTPTRYYKNALLNTADSLVEMRKAWRNIQYLEELKASPEFLNFARRADGNREIPKGWIETKIPQLQGWKMDPKLAHVFDDFYKPGFEGLDSLRKINQFATASMFWQPLPHIENVLWHWFTGRGWDWLRPGPMKHFMQDGMRAIREVVTQGPEYQRLLREGSGLIYGGVKNADFYTEMAKKFGMAMEKDPERWGKIASKLGFNTTADFVAWWYGKMRNVLWAANDMFMLQRVFELERKGMSTRRAIQEAEKHIPNYRIPSEVLGSRAFSKTLQEPAFTIFSRYHYGMWNSYANMLKDMIKGGNKERFEAAGNMAALGVLLMGILPAANWALQKATGDEKAKKLARGSASIPEWIHEWYKGDISLPQFLSNTITVAPATKEIAQQFTGKDFFTGQDIAPSRNPLRHPVQRAEHALTATISPYATAQQLTDVRPGARTPGRTLFDILAGAKNTSEATERGRERSKVFTERADRRREARPKGLIERGIKYLGPEE